MDIIKELEAWRKQYNHKMSGFVLDSWVLKFDELLSRAKSSVEVPCEKTELSPGAFLEVIRDMNSPKEQDEKKGEVVCHILNGTETWKYLELPIQLRKQKGRLIFRPDTGEDKGGK